MSDQREAGTASVGDHSTGKNYKQPIKFRETQEEKDGLEMELAALLQAIQDSERLLETKSNQNRELRQSLPAANELAHQATNDTFECSMCLDLFEVATMSSCGHGFCQRCLIQLQANGARNCSNCRSVVQHSVQAASVDQVLKEYRQLNDDQV